MPDQMRPTIRGRARKMTPAKARRLVDALAAVCECEDVEGGDRVAFEDARAAVDHFLGADQ